MPRRKKKGRSAKKNKNQTSVHAEPEEVAKAPHSFVIHRGRTGAHVQDLTADVRKVMEPFTASKIKVRPKNVIKDFVHLAGVMNVSHMVMFTRTEKGPYIKFSRFPRGPTLTFKISNYTLARDVRASLKRQVTYEHQFLNHPLLILNGFSDSGQVPAEAEGVNPAGGREIALMTSMFQNMFPSINVTSVKLGTIRCCVLFNYNKEDGTVEFRHYTIKVVPVGMSKPVKKLVQGKIPNLSRYDSISEYLASGGGNVSESEAEDDEASHVSVPKGVNTRGNFASQKSSVKLVELGPRITMELVKIEEGLLDGEVLYHKYVIKTDEEKAKIKKTLDKRKKGKMQRKAEQERNVERKVQAKEDHKQKSLEGMMKKTLKQVDKADLPSAFQGEVADDVGDSDADEEWYRKEVGEAPDKEMFDTGHKKRKMSSDLDGVFKKRMKKSANSNQKSGSGGKPSGKFSKKPPSGPKFKTKKSSAVAKGGRPGDRKGGKKPARVYNSQGIGPNFSKKAGRAPPAVRKSKRR